MNEQPELKTGLTTGKVRFSYLQVLEPKAVMGGDPKYSASLIIPKSDKKTIKAIEKCIENAKIIGKISKFGGKIPKNLKISFHDGDEDREDDEAYEDSMYVSANSKTQPGIVDKDLNAILDPDEIYSGCYGRANINFYAFDFNGNKGIACGLQHIQKLKDGEKLGGNRIKVEDAFNDDFEDDDDDDDLL